MARKKFLSLTAVAAAAALSLSACSPSATESSEESSSADGSKKGGSGESLTIGIKFDQPGLGFREGSNDPTGFDVEVARFVAKEMGVDEADITWVQTPSANRENALENGEVDMIFATYSITDERKERVAFAGPYFVAGQDLLVRADEEEITGPDSLDGKNLCSVTGSTSAQKIKDEYSQGVNLVEQGGYAECVTYLESGQVDAVTTDDIILAGLAGTEANKGKFKVVGDPFSVERYGVGLNKDNDTCQQINDAIQKMKDEGAWEEALKSNTEGTGYEADDELNSGADAEFESCD
ncbi:glutamate ABC transporter substrate-binding protein [Micrococcus lylae]|uniref:Glutamate binding protein n=2 Tax=Micrococcus lylae TaxID=1273 RepID=A0A1R4ITJ0_9MICC|nr:MULTISPECIES: glutamate ABC transporter substrate-binding protein [Micrococcus]MCT2007941.1 glutamate ABC transporter substrate-binding protein [Micrococcus lylae]MCT2072108.1 glutamate ABC transporter substrate-binding protein [Micrococcus lylae]OFR87540.1 ABC transporter substrate-binding protein [Micrococcus sp. HMSC067E09]PNL18313.1 ABC transporter substrate-binding protein [Micrococcus sp. FDAARGOS_333]SJN23018.1 Glutamate binding protein [Micrococcus lylae]